MLKLGWKAGPEQYPPVDLLEYTRIAERAGYDLVDISDHFHPWSEAGQASFAWTWMGAAAVQTERIAIGPGVTCPILRYHPAIIAQAAATVSHFAPNRTYLGVGTGEALNEFAATGVWPDYAERRDRLAEALNLIRELWTGEEVTFKGRYYQTHKAKLYTAPQSPIPIYISAMTPHSAEFAGEYGDGLVSVGGKPPARYKEIMKRFEDRANHVGKNPSSLPRLIELNVAYTNNIEGAIQEQLKYWAGTYIPALYNENIYTPAMSAENGMVVGPDTVKQTGCFSSNPEDHVNYTRQHIELGFDHIIFHTAGPDQREFIQKSGQDILPRLRKLNT
jgi:coenzyme F420-dependent glucose-6-phosphate dehydrogenase